MRMLVCFPLCFLLVLPGWLPNAYCSSWDDSAAVEFFETAIRPLFAEKCIGCHGSKKQEGGLRLNSRTGVMTGGDSGPAILPGNPQESLLIRAVGYQGELKMPPDGKLAEKEIAHLVRWIQNGAVWPGDEHGDPPVSSDTVSATKSDLWSLQPVSDSPLPEVQTQGWSVSPIDFFILNALEKQELRPSPPADQPVAFSHGISIQASRRDTKKMRWRPISLLRDC